MPLNFGTGPKLKDACRWLQNDQARREQIMDVAERNSVIEGLPPFQEETRQRLMKELKDLLAQQLKPAE